MKKERDCKPQIIYVWLEAQLKLPGDLRVLISDRGRAWHTQGPRFDPQHCKNKMKHTNKKNLFDDYSWHLGVDSLRTEPLPCGIYHPLQVDGATAELN